MNNILRSLTNIPSKKILGVDIGGTLTKTAFLVPRNDPMRQDAARFESVIAGCESLELANGESIYLKKLKSSQINQFVDFVLSNDLVEDKLHATGGGAHKYTELFDQKFVQRGIQVNKHDEMASLVKGLSFVLKHANRSVFSVPGSPALPNESTNLLSNDAQ